MPIPDALWKKVEESLRAKLEPVQDEVWQKTWEAVGASGYLSGLEGENVPTLEEVKNLDYSPAQKYFDAHGMKFVQDTVDTDVAAIKSSLENNWGDQSAFVEELSPLYSEDRLTTIYRSEIHMAQNGASLEAATNAGMQTKTRHVTGDDRSCEVCMEYDQETVGIDEMFSDSSFDGHTHPSCRCVLTYGTVEKSVLQKYGTSEGVERSWDTRGRGRKVETEAKKRGLRQPGRPHPIDFKNSPTIKKMLEVYEKDQNVFDRGGVDPTLVGLIKEQGGDGLPKVVSKEEMDKQIAQGKIELWRGVDTKDHALQFQSGELFVGVGLHGGGVYTAYGPQGKRNADYYGAMNGTNPCTMRMTLGDDAVITDIEDIERDMNENAKVYAKFGNAHEQHARLRMFYDPGRFAAACGYDAIRVPDLNFMMILNRSKVILEEVK